MDLKRMIEEARVVGNRLQAVKESGQDIMSIPDLYALSRRAALLAAALSDLYRVQANCPDFSNGVPEAQP